jgi:hypothetical protein
MAKKNSDKWNESWNEEDWQGRTKKQVDYFHLVIGICLSIFIIFSLTLIFL